MKNSSKIVGAIAAVGMISPASATVWAWSSLGLADGAPVASGTSITADGTQMTLTWTVNDPNGSGLATVPTISSDYVYYESSDPQGGEANNLGFAYDPPAIPSYPNGMSITGTLTFVGGVTDLQFSFLDIDQRDGDNRWDDTVEISINGTNVRSTPTLFSLGGAGVELDDETFLDGFEGTSSVNGTPATSTAANVYIDTTGSGLIVNTVSFTLQPGDDHGTGYGSSLTGLSDLTATAAPPVPEPSAGLLILLGCTSGLLKRRRA